MLTHWRYCSVTLSLRYKKWHIQRQLLCACQGLLHLQWQKPWQRLPNDKTSANYSQAFCKMILIQSLLVLITQAPGKWRTMAWEERMVLAQRNGIYKRMQFHSIAFLWCGNDYNKYNLETHVTGYAPKHFLRNRSQLNAIEHLWWQEK